MSLRVPLLVAVVLLLAAGPPRIADAASRTITCRSKLRHTSRCAIDTRGGVELRRQLSQAGCWKNDTWGYDSRGIWVSNGCGAEFAVGGVSAAGSHGSAGSRPPSSASGISGGEAAAAALIVGALAAAVIASQRGDDGDDDDRDADWGSPYWHGEDDWDVVRCQSRNDRETYCRTGRHRGVELHRRLSGSRCIFRETWGYDREGIWVDEGCKGEFYVRRRR